jgi:hypothetical protein
MYVICHNSNKTISVQSLHLFYTHLVCRLCRPLTVILETGNWYFMLVSVQICTLDLDIL